MASYTTNLKTWGSTGQIYPDNYSYVEGEQPVDAWDNFFNYNTVEDIQHLVDLTNARVADEDGSEAQSGGVRLQNNEWLAARNMAGDGDVQLWSANASDQIVAGDIVKLGGDLLAEGGKVIWDESAGEIPHGVADVNRVDDENLWFGDDSDVGVRFNSLDDGLVIRDGTNSIDRVSIDRTSGNLSISGELTENASI